jgi:hypothetical protein
MGYLSTISQARDVPAYIDIRPVRLLPTLYKNKKLLMKVENLRIIRFLRPKTAAAIS